MLSTSASRSRRVVSHKALTTVEVVRALQSVITRECSNELDTPWCITAAALTTSMLKTIGWNAKPHVARMFALGDSVLKYGDRHNWRPEHYLGVACASCSGAMDEDGRPWPGHVTTVIGGCVLFDAAVAQHRANGLDVPDVLVRRIKAPLPGDVDLARCPSGSSSAAFLYEFHRWDATIACTPEWIRGLALARALASSFTRQLARRPVPAP